MGWYKGRVVGMGGGCYKGGLGGWGGTRERWVGWVWAATRETGLLGEKISSFILQLPKRLAKDKPSCSSTSWQRSSFPWNGSQW